MLFADLFWLDTFLQFTSNTLPQKQLVTSHCMSGAIVNRTTSVVSSIFVWMLVECGSRCVSVCVCVFGRVDVQLPKQFRVFG